MTTQKTSTYQEQMDALSGGVTVGDALTIDKLTALIKAVRESKYYGWKEDVNHLKNMLEQEKDRVKYRRNYEPCYVTAGSTAFSAINRCGIRITSTPDDGDFAEEAEE